MLLLETLKYYLQDSDLFHFPMQQVLSVLCEIILSIPLPAQ